MKVNPSSLAPILRSDTQGRILARLMTNPSQRYTLTDLVRCVDSSMPTVMREVGRAEAAGILTTEKIGPIRLVKANPTHPLYDALSQIVLTTYGVPAIIEREFYGLVGASAVIIFGSWAQLYRGDAGRSPNDIDVLVIGTPSRELVDAAADRAEDKIGLPVQATIRSVENWKEKNDPFINGIKNKPFTVVFNTGEPALGLALD